MGARFGGIRTASRIAIVAETAADARDVMIEGESGFGDMPALGAPEV